MNKKCKKKNRSREDFKDRLKRSWVYVLLLCLIVIFTGLIIDQRDVAEAEEERGISVQSTAEAAVKEVDKEEAKNEAPSQVEGASSPKTEVRDEIPESVVLPPVKSEKVYDTTRLIIDGVGTYTVNILGRDSAFDILSRASKENGFELEGDYYSWGIMVTKIGDKEAKGTYYWAFYYNGAYAQVGANAQKVSKNDVTEWRYESWQ